MEEGKKEKENGGKEIGKVVHYYSHLGVAVVELSDTLKVGDKIKIKGATSNFEQAVKSMQVEHRSTKESKAGESIGLKVEQHARKHDMVYRL